MNRELVESIVHDSVALGVLVASGVNFNVNSGRPWESAGWVELC